MPYGRTVDEVTIRPWRSDDAPFLWEMLYESLHVRAGGEPFPRSVLDQPDIAHYLTDFGQRTGDDALVAEVDGERVGAAWCRRLDSADPGYGYVHDAIPELGMAVESGWRGRGIGRRLLLELIVHHPVMSLSVDDENLMAIEFYRSVGFVAVDEDDHAEGPDDGSTTMLLRTA